MKIWPALDIRHGRVVQLVGGDPDNVGVQGGDPSAHVAKWRESGARRLHVVDLDGALGETRQLHLMDRLRTRGLPIQFGGGVRHMTDIQRLLELGAERVIVGTQGIRNPEWARELAILWPSRIVLAIDARGRDVAIEGWQESSGLDVVETARALDDAGFAAFLYTNVSKEGRMQGIDTSVVQDLLDAAPRTPLMVSGGIKDLADLDALAAMGVDGVVLGMSIYTGAIDLKEAIERFEGAP